MKRNKKLLSQSRRLYALLRYENDAFFNNRLFLISNENPTITDSINTEEIEKKIRVTVIEINKTLGIENISEIEEEVF